MLDLRGSAPISLAPPRGPARVPAAARHVRTRDRSSSRCCFQAVETPEGTIDRGEAFVVFERDGTANPTEIVLADDDGHALALEVLPLADTVRIHDVEI